MRESDKTRRSILEAALAEYALHGYEGSRDSRVAERAGVSTSTLRRLFPNREELFREVVRSATLRLLQGGHSAAQATGSTAELQLRDFARRFGRAMDDPSQSTLLRLALGELHRFPELAVLHAVEVLGRAGQALEGIVMRGVREGDFQVSDARAAARLALSAFLSHGLWLAYPQIYGGLTGPDPERARTEAVEFVLRAWRGGESLAQSDRRYSA